MNVSHISSLRTCVGGDFMISFTVLGKTRDETADGKDQMELESEMQSRFYVTLMPALPGTVQMLLEVMGLNVLTDKEKVQ